MGELVQPEGGREDCLEVCFFGTSGRRRLCMVPCLVLVIIFIGFEGAKRWGKL